MKFIFVRLIKKVLLFFVNFTYVNKLSLKFWHNWRINFDKTIIQNVQGKDCENITETELWPYLINFNEEGDEEDITFEMEGLTDKVKHKISRFNIFFQY